MPEPSAQPGECSNCLTPMTGASAGNAQRPGCTCGPGLCRWCCNCYECSACHTRHSASDPRTVRRGAANLRALARCEGCGACNERCSCPRCTGCGAYRNTGALCSTCGRGRDCCGNCGCARGWEMYKPPEGTPFHHAKSLKKLKSKRCAAVEIEVAACGRPPQGQTGLMAVVKRWGASIVSDGSVPDGFEINTAPASGDALVDQLNEMGAALMAGNASVDANCGVHVHVDARDFNFYDIKRLVNLYRLVEPALYAIVHPGRESSRYCRPCGKHFYEALAQAKQPKDVKQAFFKMNYGDEPSQSLNRRALRGNKYNEARYHALNLHSWIYRGTVEQRMHHGTVDGHKLLNWAVLQVAIMDYAYTQTQATIGSLYAGSRTPVLSTSLKALALVGDTLGVGDWVRERAAYMKRLKESGQRLPVDP